MDMTISTAQSEKQMAYAKAVLPKIADGLEKAIRLVEEEAAKENMSLPIEDVRTIFSTPFTARFILDYLMDRSERPEVYYGNIIADVACALVGIPDAEHFYSAQGVRVMKALRKDGVMNFELR